MPPMFRVGPGNSGKQCFHEVDLAKNILVKTGSMSSYKIMSEIFYKTITSENSH